MYTIIPTIPALVGIAAFEQLEIFNCDVVLISNLAINPGLIVTAL